MLLIIPTMVIRQLRDPILGPISRSLLVLVQFEHRFGRCPEISTRLAADIESHRSVARAASVIGRTLHEDPGSKFADDWSVGISSDSGGTVPRWRRLCVLR